MRVMIMCMSGITTTILANKLQKYSNSIGKKDLFIPSMVDIENEMNTKADVVVLAPQAKAFYEEMIHHTSTTVLLLDEETFVLSDAEDIYQQIALKAASSSETGEEEVSMSFRTCIDILIIACTHVIPILVFGLISLLLEQIFHIEFLHHISECFLTLISLYFIFLLGYSYGVKMKVEPLFCGLVCLSSVLILSPVSANGYINTLFHITDGTIPIEFFGFQYFPYLLIPAFLSLFLLHILMKKMHIRYINSIILHAGYLNVFLMTALIFSVFLTLRFLIGFVL